MRSEALWRRLKNYNFDGLGGSLTFPARLARETRWSGKFTGRAIEEYRRFLYLTQVIDGEATPSATVDRVWHMHLTYTRAYWDGLCDGVLRRPLHHEPSRGDEEVVRHRRQYAATRALYAEEFGEPPPRDIWRVRQRRRLRPAGPLMIAAGLVICYWTWFGVGLIVFGAAVLGMQLDSGRAQGSTVAGCGGDAGAGCGGDGGAGCGGGGGD